MPYRRDALAQIVPPRLIPAWLGGNKIKRIAKILDSLTLRVALQKDNPGAKALDLAEINEAIYGIIHKLQNRIPAAICIVCQNVGAVEENCICQGRGWLTDQEVGQYEQQLIALIKGGNARHLARRKRRGTYRSRRAARDRRLRRQNEIISALPDSSAQTHDAGGGGILLGETVQNGPSRPGIAAPTVGSSGDVG